MHESSPRNQSEHESNRTCYDGARNNYDATSLTLAILLTNLDIVVVAGNLLVLLALLTDRRLRTPTHYFIGSLAAADLALGIFVLPIAIAFETAGAWTFGVPLCQLWLAVDVWLCTASIYGLIMVGLDRYVAVTRPLAYKSFMTHRRASLMIAAAWTIALVICLPTFVVSSFRASKAVESSCQCTQMVHGPLYIVYSAVGSFYLPMAIIGYVYVRIYRTIRQIKLQGVSGVVNIDYVNSGGGTSELESMAGGAAAVASPLLVSTPSNNKPSIGSRISSCKGRLRRKNGTTRLSLSRSVPTRMTMRVHKGGYREDQTTPLLNRKQSERHLPPSSPQQGLVNASYRRSVSSSSYANLNLVTTTTAIGLKRHVGSNGAVLSPAASSPSLSQTTLFIDTTLNGGGRGGQHSDAASFMGRPLESTRTTSTTSFMGFMAVPSNLSTMWYQRMDAFHRYHQKLTSELGALKTTAHVTGCFIACWLGFTIVYTLHALPECRHTSDGGESKCVPEWVITAMVWLGYANSAINPLIYTASNEHFRRAFRTILRCDVGRKTSAN